MFHVVPGLLDDAEIQVPPSKSRAVAPRSLVESRSGANAAGTEMGGGSKCLGMSKNKSRTSPNR